MIYTLLFAAWFHSAAWTMPHSLPSCGSKMAQARPTTKPWTRDQLTLATPAVILADNQFFGVLIRAREYGASMNTGQLEELAVYLESPFCHDLDTRYRSRTKPRPRSDDRDLAASDLVSQYVLTAFAGYLEKNPGESPHRMITAIVRWLEYAVPHPSGEVNYLALFHLVSEIVLSAQSERLAEFFRAMARSQLTPHFLQYERSLRPLSNLVAAARQATPKMRPIVENVLFVRQSIPPSILRGQEARVFAREVNGFFRENGRSEWATPVDRHTMEN